jgi:apolipoprotein N-acyltransferase
MLNVSNDSWFGDSAGPRQHFAQARYRAIEEGLPLIRSASGGISGAIDAWGRVRGELSPHEAGVLDVALPVAAPPTFYSKYGDLASLLLLIVLVGAGAGAHAKLPGSTLTKRND